MPYMFFASKRFISDVTIYLLKNRRNLEMFPFVFYFRKYKLKKKKIINI